MELLNLIVGLIGALGGFAGGWSAWVAHQQWKSVNRKVAMLTASEAAFDVVPAWYTSRMMLDHWLFGLQITDGRTVAIRRIKAISSDAVWMDVELATEDEVGHVHRRYHPLTLAVADDRRSASLRINNIQAALDLQTS